MSLLLRILQREAASLRTETLSTSAGLSRFISPPATPSIRISGDVSLLIVLTPRMTIDEAEPGFPVVFDMVTPGSSPCSPAATLVIGRSFSTSPLTIDTAPVTLIFFLCSVTDNNNFAKSVASSFITMLTGFESLAMKVWSVLPMYEIFIVEPLSALILNLPLMSVTTFFIRSLNADNCSD